MNKENSSHRFLGSERFGPFRIAKYWITKTLSNGGKFKGERVCFERGDSVAVLLYDVGDLTVTLGREWRIGPAVRGQHPWTNEIIAGGIDEGEDPRVAALREVEEEAPGCEVESLEQIAVFYSSPGGTSERIWVYLARVDSSNVATVGGLASEGEDIQVMRIALDECYRMIERGDICSAMSIIAFQHLRAQG